MNLSKEQLDLVETFGGLNYPPEKIVMILELDHDDFFVDFNLPDSDPDYKPGQIRYHYDRGLLMAQAEIDKINLKLAREGNMTSMTQFKKDTLYREAQNAKKKTVYAQEKTNVENLKQLIETSEPGTLTVIQTTYFEQLDFVRTLFGGWTPKATIINSIRTKWPEVSRRQAIKLYYDAINFFFLDNVVKIEAWKNFIAEKLDNLASYAIELNDLEEARRCLVEVAKLRGVYESNQQAVPPELLDRRPIIYTLDIEKMGIPKVNRYELAAFIDNLDLTQKEKLKIRKDAMIDETPFDFNLDDEKN